MYLNYSIIIAESKAIVLCLYIRVTFFIFRGFLFSLFCFHRFPQKSNLLFTNTHSKTKFLHFSSMYFFRISLPATSYNSCLSGFYNHKKTFPTKKENNFHLNQVKTALFFKYDNYLYFIEAVQLLQQQNQFLLFQYLRRSHNGQSP